MIRQESFDWRKTSLALTLALALGASLAACGKKADLDPPPGEPDNYGHQYPDPEME